MGTFKDWTKLEKTLLTFLASTLKLTIDENLFNDFLPFDKSRKNSALLFFNGVSSNENGGLRPIYTYQFISKQQQKDELLVQMSTLKDIFLSTRKIELANSIIIQDSNFINIVFKMTKMNGTFFYIGEINFSIMI